MVCRFLVYPQHAKRPPTGKTVVAVALAHIFGFGHTQSDDVHIKKPAPQFIKNVAALLQDHDVVIADKYVLQLSDFIRKTHTCVGITICVSIVKPSLTLRPDKLNPPASSR